MWGPATRRRYSRTGPRYARSDLTDAEWAPIEPPLPAACGRGRPRSWSWREILDAICYVLRGGIAWPLLPTDLPPRQTTYRWFATWRDAGPFAAINHAPVMADREWAGRAGRSRPDGRRDGRPVGQDHRERRAAGLRRGQEGQGPRAPCPRRHRRPRPAHPGARGADIQDRDGAVPLLRASRGLLPWIVTAFADAGYVADRVAAATRIAIEIVGKHPDQVGFAVHPRRWVVERSFARLGRNRRLAKDVDATLASATAFLYAASVLLLIRRLARPA